MSNRPQSPCGKPDTGCKRRSIDECLACEEWKAYKAEMQKIYDANAVGDTVSKANFDRKAKRLHMLCRKTKRR